MTKQELLKATKVSSAQNTPCSSSTSGRHKSMERLRGLIESPIEMTPGEKLKRAMELSSLGLKMKRQTLRRDSPEASKAKIQQEFDKWLYQRDTAPLGDCPGRQRQIQ